jgi:hypothetical protein
MKNDHISCFPENLDSGLRRNDEFNQSSSLPLVERKQELKKRLREFIILENNVRKSNDTYKDSFCQCLDFADQCAKDGLIQKPDDLLSALVEIVKGTDAALTVFAFALGFGIQSLEEING